MNSENNNLTFKVKKEEEGLALSEFLRNVGELSSRFVKKAIREGRIKVNNNAERLSYKLKIEDVIEAQINREEEQDILPEKMDLSIIYEDKDIIVVDKPKGIVVHPTKRHISGTLSNGLLYYFREKGDNSIVRLVNRLDMDTSGLIIVAKNSYSHMALSRDMVKDEFVKSYLAVVHGNLVEAAGVIDKPIYRVGEGMIKRVIDERGQRSITRFEVIEKYKDAELVKLTLETGRTHQIRVHLSSIGHPIFGDALYGEEELEYIDRQALHAYRLEFPHPTSREIIKLESEIPQDIKNLIEKLRK